MNHVKIEVWNKIDKTKQELITIELIIVNNWHDFHKFYCVKLTTRSSSLHKKFAFL